MTHAPVNDLTAVSAELLTAARAASGRATRTLVGERGQPMHQMLVALLAEESLAEHGNPGQASVQVLHGALTVTTDDQSLAGQAGSLITIPDQPHAVRADQDTVFLLTVATRQA